jgi:16S rRNA (guanine966-N2)-methyltransferase
MRVIAGQYRSRPLRSLRGVDIRPTSDRLRETLFNVLSHAGGPARAASDRAADVGGRLPVADSVWLDLYGGTGAVGIEALSRGARTVYFVESSRSAVAVIRENLKSLGISEGFEVIERDVEQALRLLDSEAIVCDYCFLDPPYRLTSAYEETLGFLGQSQLLRATSIVVAEHEKRFDPGARFGALERFRMLRQGDAALSFYRLA